MDSQLMTLNKAAAAIASEPDPIPSGKPQGGPNSAPRGGKYISRKWNGSKWEYEYKAEPHPEKHGLGHVSDKSEHTMPLPEGVGSEHGHSEDQAYKLAINHAITQKNAVFPSKDPVTGEEIVIRIGTPAQLDAQGNVVKNPVIFRQKKDPEAKAGPTGRVRTPKFGERLKTISSVRNLEIANDAVAPTEHLDEAGNVIGTSRPHESRLSADKERSRATQYREKAARLKLNPEHSGTGKAAKIQAKDPKQAAERIAANKKKIAMGKTAPPVGNQMASGASATSIVAGGSLPFVPGARPRTVAIKFDSPQEEQSFVNSFAAENAQSLYNTGEFMQKEAARMGVELDDAAITGFMGGPDIQLLGEFYKRGLQPTPEQLSKINIDPNSPAYRGVLSAAAQFTPGKGDVGTFSAAKIKSSARQEFMAQHKAGGKELASTSGNKIQQAHPAGDGRANPSEIETSYGMGQGSQDMASGEMDPDDQLEAMGEERGDSDTEGSEDYSQPDESINPEELASWKQEQMHKLTAFANTPQGAQLKPALLHFSDAIEDASDSTDIDAFHNVLQGGFRKMGLGQHAQAVVHPLGTPVGKSLEDQEFDKEIQILKGAFINMLDTYSHTEGSEDHPIFYYKDQSGNLKRYTNAPEGHTDHTKLAGEPQLHYTEPTIEKNPEYFTPDGRKLTRAPFPNTQMQWNPNYHEDDPVNLWVGRWVNPVTGDHEFTYLAADMGNQPKLRINRQNTHVDVMIKYYRSYASQLFHSQQVKDHITGMCLILMDQGRMKPSEIAGLAATDVEISGDLIRLGERVIHADPKFQMAITALLMRSADAGPLFDIPQVDANGKYNPAYIRRVGPHYLINVSTELGIPPACLQTYQATQIYSQEVQKLLTLDNATLEVAHHFALLEVARKMGYDIDRDPDVNLALTGIQNSLIDPVVFEVIMGNAQKLEVHEGLPQLGKTSFAAVPIVNADLVDKTPAEQEFGTWLHSYPVHAHAEELNLVIKSNTYKGGEIGMTVHGLPIVIEFEAGQEKHNKKLNYDYGYIDLPVTSTDGDAVDVFLGPDESPEYVFVIKKNKRDDFSTYDEDKVMLGWPDLEAARTAFLEYYEHPEMIRDISSVSLAKFKKDIENHTSKAPITW